MSLKLILGMLALGAVFVSFGGFLYFFLFRSQKSQMGLGGAGNPFGSTSSSREYLKDDPSGQRYKKLKKQQQKEFRRQKTKATEENKYLAAGLYTDDQIKKFQTLKIIMPCLLGPILGFGVYFLLGDIKLSLATVVIGVLLGVRVPNMKLDSIIQKRSIEIMYYLPLVIEQIAIGVSSSLDIGPCLQRVVQMADERDSHNVVTELVRRVQYMIRTGASLEEALVEIGNNSGHNELKHTFVALSQVAKHGGEISKQLMELADSVNTQRETKTEAVIKQLELKATGPVALVFLGFIIIILIGFGIQIKKGLL